MKSRFKSKEEAERYKALHRLHNQVAVPISGTRRWALIFPIKAHVTVNDGAPAEYRKRQ